MTTSNTAYKFVISVTPKKNSTKSEEKARLEKKVGSVKHFPARANADEARFVVSVKPNGKTQAEEKARLEKRLGTPVSYLGRVLHAAKVNEARWA
jgi:hypothetical protein